jgi:hypothetical protein
MELVRQGLVELMGVVISLQLAVPMSEIPGVAHPLASPSPALSSFFSSSS